jgi:PAS domain-containing protein
LRNYILTENERKTLNRWLEFREELTGYPILKNRILRNFGAILEDVKLIAEYAMVIEGTLPAQSQSEALEIRKWLLSYLSKAAPTLSPDIGKISDQYDQQSALLGVALDNAPEAIIVASRDGDVLYANNAFAKLAEKPRNELASGKYDFFNITEEFHTHMGELEEGKTFNGTLYTERLGASPKWVEVSANSFKLNGESATCIACLQDVTRGRAWRRS